MLCISWAALMEMAVLSLFSCRLQARSQATTDGIEAGNKGAPAAQSRYGGLRVCSVNNGNCWGEVMSRLTGK
jgi:hypothetical protein